MLLNTYKMNKKTLLFFFLPLALSMKGQSTSDCDNLLQGGLYSLTKMTNTGSFSQDLRTYYLSEQFKTDIKSGKWGGSLTIPIEGVPFTIGADASDENYQEFRSKLLKISELKIESNYYQSSFSAIPNTTLYQSYVDCIRIVTDVSKTGFIEGKNVETEDAVVFTIYYRPQSPNDPMPIVQKFNVEPFGAILSGDLKVGEKLSSYSLLVSCRKVQDKDVILTLQTDRGSHISKSFASESISSSKELPIGTVITSFLNFEQFNVASKNNEKSPGGIWTSQKSKWSPCDGRPVPSSKYATITSQNQIPDLRGMFVRGLNTFDLYQPVPQRSSNESDPENRVVGTVQQDAIESHSHNLAGATGGEDTKTVGLADDWNNRPNKAGGMTGRYAHGTWAKNYIQPNEGGKSETRPINVAVYYYIKIN